MRLERRALLSFLLALALGAAAVARHREAHELLLDSYDRHTLPGFDAHVYVAMAERPPIFTLGPWGYRLLTPALVQLLPSDAARGFAIVSFAGLAFAAALLQLFLSRLGHGAVLSILAAAAFALLAPVESAVAYPFLVEPLTLVLVLLLLLGLEAGAGPSVLALIAVLAALSKEITLLFLPTLYFARRELLGPRRALIQALLAAAPALLVTLLLRVWAPPSVAGATPLGVLALALWRIVERADDWGPVALLSGLTPLALLGALRARGKALLARYGWMLGVVWVLPFVASVYTDDPSVPFFLDDIPRLLLYALPVMLALALALFSGRAAPPPRAPARYGDAVAFGCAFLALAFALSPLLLDPYRRVPLRGPRDGRLVLAVCRESLTVAEALARGRTVAYDAETRSFTPGKTVPELLGRMRWFLRDGWGPRPQYGSGPIVAEAVASTLLVPAFVPEDLNAVLLVSAPAAWSVRVEVNGRAIAEAAVTAEASRVRLVIPGGTLVRGDNLLRLVAPAPGLRLHDLRLRAAR